MRLDNLRNPSLASSPRATVAAKLRRALYALTALAALHGTACGNGNGETDNPDGGAGAAGATGGTGGVDAGGHDTGGAAGAGGEAGGDPCADLEFDGLGSKVYDVNENGSFTLSGLTGPDAPYNGMAFEVKDGSMFIDRARVGLQKVIYDNYQTGYEALGDLSGVRPVVIDADQPYIEDSNGSCTLNLIDIDTTVLSDPQKRPVLRTPQNYYTTAFNVKENSEEIGDYQLLADRTEVRLDSLHTASEKIDVILGDSNPVVTASAYRDQDGHIVANLAGTTDEGVGSDEVLEKLGLTASGLTFAPVQGEPNLRRTTTPSNLTSLNLEVEGLNEGLTDDTTSETVAVTETDLCDGVNCEDNNECTTDTCNPNDGLCDNDPVPNIGNNCNDNDPLTINDQCNNSGVCEGTTVTCTQDIHCDDNDACNGTETCDTNNNTCVGGTPIDHDDGLTCNGVEGCNPANGNLVPGTPVSCTTNASCEEPAGTCSCDPGYTDSIAAPGTCVDDPCDPDPCNSHGTCSMDGADQSSCACDTGFAAPNCGSCDTGYENYPTCSADVTPPNAPVITTSGGNNFTIHQAPFTIDGTTDSDTHEMWYNIDGGSFNLLNLYSTFSTNWSYNGNIPSNFEAHNYCFKAEDEANNQSATDCIQVTRLP